MNEEIIPYVLTYNQNDMIMFGILKNYNHLLISDTTVHEALSDTN